MGGKTFGKNVSEESWGGLAYLFGVEPRGEDFDRIGEKSQAWKKRGVGHFCSLQVGALKE